ncbi:hypothetical protein Q4I32_000608 [Leishmania shawi]|uniref:Secreted protein n=1 Tax=Leishmania shawi TaxID=5680 RepID=A0AAW3CBC9_9TRYP
MRTSLPSLLMFNAAAVLLSPAHCLTISIPKADAVAAAYTSRTATTSFFDEPMYIPLCLTPVTFMTPLPVMPLTATPTMPTSTTSAGCRC